MTTATVAAARHALAAGDFDGALALAGELGPSDADDVLLVRADAAYAAGRFEEALAAHERLYRSQHDAGRTLEAAATAARIALHLLVDTGLLASVRGWVTRSERLLAGADAPARAVLAAISTYERLLSGDAERAADHAAAAIALGERHDVPFARFLGRIATARLAAISGHVEEGMAELDDVAVELMSGDHEPFLIGNLYCELVCAAQTLLLLDRAREWTDVVDRWRHGVAFGGMHGRCRVHRAELLRISGPAAAAEEEALAACAELQPWMRREFGWPLVELGTTRLRRGDLAGAEEAFHRAQELAWPPLPGLALLRMEQGDLVAAADLVATEIAHPTVLPWKERPPIADLQVVPMLEVQVEIAAAAGDTDLARSAATRLRGLAERFGTPGIGAGADLATARAALVTGEARAAAEAAAAATAAYIDLGAPYDAAMARVVCGHALSRTGEAGRARVEWRCAREAFEVYGARRRVAEVAALLAETTTDLVDPPAVTRTAELVRRRDGWQVALDGRAAQLPDLKGLRMLRRLLAEPGREFHVLDLAEARVVSSGMPVLDDEAKAVYRQRLAEVEADIAEAEAAHDLARIELAGRDREYLVHELTSAVGLGGRSRTVGGTVERCRTSVTRTLRYAIRRVTGELPDLGAHLTASVHTGVECRYDPDPTSRLHWDLADTHPAAER